MDTTVATPPAAPAPAPVAPQPSPRSPVPPDAASKAAILENAKKIFPSDPGKPVAPAPQEVAPAKPAVVSSDDAPPAAPSIIEKPKAEPPQSFPEDSLPEPVSEAAKSGWKELKRIAKEERQRASTLEQQISELKKAPATATSAGEVESLRLELASTKEQSKAALDRLLVLDLQNHPDFARQYSEPRKKAFAESELLLRDNGVENPPSLDSLLTKPRAEFAKTVSDLAAKMNSFDAQTFTANMRQAYQLAGDEKAAIAKAGDVHQQLQQQSAQAQRKAFDSVAADIIPNFARHEITDAMSPEERTAAQEYNQSVETLRQRAEGFAFGKLKETDVANLSFKAVALDHMVKHAMPRLERHVQAQNKIISEQAAALNALRGKRGPSSDGSESSPAPASESIADAAKRVWGKT